MKNYHIFEGFDQRQDYHFFLRGVQTQVFTMLPSTPIHVNYCWKYFDRAVLKFLCIWRFHIASIAYCTIYFNSKVSLWRILRKQKDIGSVDIVNCKNLNRVKAWMMDGVIKTILNMCISFVLSLLIYMSVWVGKRKKKGNTLIFENFTRCGSFAEGKRRPFFNQATEYCCIK